MTTRENQEGNVGHSSIKLTYGRSQIEWRRSRVLELSSECYTIREIATKLEIARGTVSNDLIFLRNLATSYS